MTRPPVAVVRDCEAGRQQWRVVGQAGGGWRRNVEDDLVEDADLVERVGQFVSAVE
jgi:hypothetical protein